MDKFSLAAVGILGLVGIEIAALCNGIDGALMISIAAGIGAIVAGTIGYSIPSQKGK